MFHHLLLLIDFIVETLNFSSLKINRIIAYVPSFVHYSILGVVIDLLRTINISYSYFQECYCEVLISEAKRASDGSMMFPKTPTAMVIMLYRSSSGKSAILGTPTLLPVRDGAETAKMRFCPKSASSNIISKHHNVSPGSTYTFENKRILRKAIVQAQIMKNRIL